MILRGPSTDLRPLHPGLACAELAVLTEPLSFWGGVDRRSGAIIDVHHPQHGLTLAGKILVMRAGRGSSSGSSVLAEVLRNGCGPVGIVLSEPDLIISLGVLVAAELYGLRCPTVTVSDSGYARLDNGEIASLRADAPGNALTADRAQLETPGASDADPAPRSSHGRYPHPLTSPHDDRRDEQ